ncbi:MAG: head decoration protein, partial [Alphaproteobacteria bacterium]|nr:head decoration protein [Alphaproteobacteria bacterium]
MTINESFHAGGFMISEGPGTRSRDQITIASGQSLKAGTVLGKLLSSTSNAVSTAGGGNTGNGVMGTVSVGAGAIVGNYKLE